jgi:Ca2+-binding EF-hand superfamily protein
MKPIHAIIISVLVSTLAMADVKTPSPSASEVIETFKSLDANTDQRISKEEAKADKSVVSRFAAIDSNGDGYIDQDEYLARPETKPFE